jgi:hypothetical protein
VTGPADASLSATGILSGEVTSDPFEGWTELLFRLDLDVRGDQRGEITIANLHLPVRSWRQVAGTVVTKRPGDPAAADDASVGAGLVQLGDNSWFANVEHLEFTRAAPGDARLLMHVELREAANAARRLVLDGPVQLGVIRVAGGERALIAARGLLDLEHFEPATDADTDTLVLRPRAE